MKSVVNPNKVTFSAGARTYVGPYGTDPAALPSVGLLKADATLNPEQTVRQKKDQFPEVVVAESIQAQQLQLQMVVREWTKDNLLLAFGLETADITEEAGGDTAVTDEAHTFNADGLITLAQPLKAGAALTVTTTDGVTTFTEGSDYILIPRDIQGRSLVYRLSGGTIAAGASVHVDYTYNLPARRIYPIGRRATVVYRTVKLVEEYVNGGRMEVVLWKARLGVNGNFDINSAENGADIPLVVQAIFDPSHDELASLYEVEGA